MTLTAEERAVGRIRRKIESFQKGLRPIIEVRDDRRHWLPSPDEAQSLFEDAMTRWQTRPIRPSEPAVKWALGVVLHELNSRYKDIRHPDHRYRTLTYSHVVSGQEAGDIGVDRAPLTWQQAPDLGNEKIEGDTDEPDNWYTWGLPTTTAADNRAWLALGQLATVKAQKDDRRLMLAEFEAVHLTKMLTPEQQEVWRLRMTTRLEVVAMLREVTPGRISQIEHQLVEDVVEPLWNRLHPDEEFPEEYRRRPYHGRR